MNKYKIIAGLLLTIPVIPFLTLLQITLFCLQGLFSFIDWIHNKIWLLNSQLLGFEESDLGEDIPDSVIVTENYIKEVYSGKQS